MFMNFRKLIVFITFLVMIFNSYSLNYNSTYETVALEVEGWCTNFPIEFTIYNNTELTDSDFQDDLCGANEDPINDTCEEYKVVNANLVIYDGPFNTLTKLLDSKFIENKNNYTFTKENQYLVQVRINSGKYNDYEEEIIVEECNLQKPASGKNVQPTDKYNNTFISQLKIAIIKS